MSTTSNHRYNNSCTIGRTDEQYILEELPPPPPQPGQHGYPLSLWWPLYQTCLPNSQSGEQCMQIHYFFFQRPNADSICFDLHKAQVWCRHHWIHWLCCIQSQAKVTWAIVANVPGNWMIYGWTEDKVSEREHANDIGGGGNTISPHGVYSFNVCPMANGNPVTDSCACLNTWLSPKHSPFWPQWWIPSIVWWRTIIVFLTNINNHHHVCHSNSIRFAPSIQYACKGTQQWPTTSWVQSIRYGWQWSRLRW